MNGFLAKMSQRERRLLTISAVLIACVLAYLVITPAIDYVTALDERIADREFQLIQYSEHAARASAVDTEYAKVAREHGSDLTQQAIHDSLRAELLRLAAREMPEPGQGVVATNPNARLVSFRDLPEGTLTSGLEGYREYTIEVRTVTGAINDHIEFLKRIQQSPIALRVKKLELIRQHNQIGQATAVIELARIVVDGVPLEQVAVEGAAQRATIVNGGFEEYDDILKSFAGWETEGATLAQNAGWATEGKLCAALTPEDANAAIYQELTVSSGTTYECSVDVIGMADARVGVADDAGEFIGEPIAAAPQGAAMRYTFRFANPGKARAIRMPMIRLNAEAEAAYIDNVVLTEVSESE